MVVNRALGSSWQLTWSKVCGHGVCEATRRGQDAVRGRPSRAVRRGGAYAKRNDGETAGEQGGCHLRSRRLSPASHPCCLGSSSLPLLRSNIAFVKDPDGYWIEILTASVAAARHVGHTTGSGCSAVQAASLPSCNCGTNPVASFLRPLHPGSCKKLCNGATASFCPAHLAINFQLTTVRCFMWPSAARQQPDVCGVGAAGAAGGRLSKSFGAVGTRLLWTPWLDVMHN